MGIKNGFTDHFWGNPKYKLLGYRVTLQNLTGCDRQTPNWSLLRKLNNKTNKEVLLY